MKFEYLAWEWFENKKKYIKESTSAYYIFELQNYILPALGDMETDELNEDIILKRSIRGRLAIILIIRP